MVLQSELIETYHLLLILTRNNRRNKTGHEEYKERDSYITKYSYYSSFKIFLFYQFRINSLYWNLILTPRVYTSFPCYTSQRISPIWLTIFFWWEFLGHRLTLFSIKKRLSDYLKVSLIPPPRRRKHPKPPVEPSLHSEGGCKINGSESVYRYRSTFSPMFYIRSTHGFFFSGTYGH